MSTTVYDYVGVYGPDWKQGVLSEHLYLAGWVGIREHITASGRHIAILPDGETWPVVCSELIEIHTEDGPIVGRCGAPVTHGPDHFCCDGHAWVEEEAARPLEDRWADEYQIEENERRSGVPG